MFDLMAKWQEMREKMPDYCGFANDRKVPDEPCFVCNANGLCASDLGDSATACRSAQRFCHTGGV